MHQELMDAALRQCDPDTQHRFALLLHQADPGTRMVTHREYRKRRTGGESQRGCGRSA
jgi:hypothetical protein